FNDPILVATTDGVVTKLKIAQAANIHNTIGIDHVAMNVNDLIVQVECGTILSRKSDINVGDILIGIPSSGIHSNAFFSLIRKIIDKYSLGYESTCLWNSKLTLGEELLIPTKIYVMQLLPLIKKGFVKAMAHITRAPQWVGLPT
ncbi:19310_t:CDS:2, partial [Cetraspora pellucida]